MEKTRIVILDFDGTLGDTAGVILNTMKATIKELRLPERTEAQCRATIGLPLTKIPAVLFPEIKEDLSEIYTETYRRLFSIYDTEDAVVLFPNVLETLKEMKAQGLTLTIASSRSHHTLDNYVKRLGMEELVSYILGAEDVANAKPNPEPVLKTLEAFGFAPEEALVIGDTNYDILMGVNAGAHTCGVNYGNGSREEMESAGADGVVDVFSDILKHIIK